MIPALDQLVAAYMLCQTAVVALIAVVAVKEIDRAVSDAAWPAPAGSHLVLDDAAVGAGHGAAGAEQTPVVGTVCDAVLVLPCAAPDGRPHIRNDWESS